MALNTPARLQAAREFLVQNRVAEAEAELRSVLEQEPGNTSAQTLLGVLYFRTGRLDSADELLTAVNQKEPKQIEAVGLLAVVRKARGDFAGAASLFQRLVDLGQLSADIYNQLGGCWLQLGDATAAGAAFKRAIELDRSLAHSYYNLGLALKLAGSSFETFATFKRSAELDPNFLDNYVQLWEQMRQLLNWREGLPLLETGLRRHPGSAQMKVMLASTYGKVGRPDKAEELFKGVLQTDPSAGPPYAHWLQEEGRFEDSIPVLKEAIRLNPVQGQPYYNLAVANCFEVDEKPLLDVVPPLLERPEIGPEGRMFLFYALAKSYDKQREYELAMRNYDSANDQAYRLYNARYDHDEFAVESEQATLTRLYPKETVERLRRFGSPSEAPIFIVGMIRTGTTLLDQILSSHPQVKSAGEQPFWRISAGRVSRRWLESEPKPSDIQELAKGYLNVLRESTGGASKVTDKMPTNFMHMGLMSIVFPGAKFIHTRRNPMDTCLSIYTTFLGSGTQFAYKQENIVGYYRAYLRTMEFWRSVIPKDQMIEIDYEELVSNKETVLRGLLQFCGLKWDDAVLSHERHVSQVSTPSLWTARQPVNTASVERWRRYEPWLGKLLELRDLSHPVV